MTDQSPNDTTQHEISPADASVPAQPAAEQPADITSANPERKNPATHSSEEAQAAHVSTSQGSPKAPNEMPATAPNGMAQHASAEQDFSKASGGEASQQKSGAPTSAHDARPSHHARHAQSTTAASAPTMALAVRGGNATGPTVIESASATTSPDNSNSGSSAYVITALALVGILLLSMGIWSCGSSLVEAGVRDGLNTMAQQWEGEGGTGTLPYGSNGSSGSQGNGARNGSSLSVPDALKLDLDLYDDTIGSTISASDYAGTPNSMRSYVLSIVHADSDHNSAVVAHLNAAAAADDPRSDVEAALTECDQAISDLNALQVPSDLGDAVAQSAQAGKDKAVARWQALEEELKLLDTQDEVSYSDLQKADSAVEQATEDAGTALVQALTQAAQAR